MIPQIAPPVRQPTTTRLNSCLDTLQHQEYKSVDIYGEYGEDISGLGISRYPVAAIEELVDQVHECELRERDQK